MRILLLEDDQATALAISEYLKGRYLVTLCSTIQQAQSYLEHLEYDVLVLDLGLPDGDGLTLCQQLRNKGLSTPILILTGQSELANKVAALDTGADDYLTKPFSLQELTARIRALNRRNKDHFQNSRVRVRDLELDSNQTTIKLHGQTLRLRRKEYLLLEYLMRHAGSIVTRDMVLSHVWGMSGEFATNTVDVHIKMLRDKIDKPYQTNIIRTMHGLGYKLEK